MATDGGNAQAIEKAQAALDDFVSRYRARNGEPQFDIDVMRRAKIVDATMAGTLAVALELGPAPPGGVTRALNLTYLRPVLLPAVVRIEAEVMQHGRSVSLSKGAILSPDGKKLYATCEHHKVAAAALRAVDAVVPKL
ncbi:hypothetical protein MMC27_006109 [Xylographa pallens]|nr:hypothetical protein [Xylographa pallens]